MKKRHFIFITICVIMWSICINASALTQGVCSENLTWVLDDNGTLTISGTGEMKTAGKWNCEDIKKIVIEEGVTSVYEGAFYDCISLKEVSLPDTLKIIEGWAFSDCITLSNINFPENLEHIGLEAFSGCGSISQIILPDSVKTIEDGAFSGCTFLKSAVLPESITDIAENTFADCSVLSSIVIPEGVKSIGTNSFDNCTGLLNISIPKSLTSIDIYAFYGCNINSVYYMGTEENWRNIGIGKYNNCLTLQETKIITDCKSAGYSDGYSYVVTNDNTASILRADPAIQGQHEIPENIGVYSVSSIASGAFSDTYGYITLVFPEGINSIGKSAFSNCFHIQKIVYSGTEENWKEIIIDEGNEYFEAAEVNFGGVISGGNESISYSLDSNGVLTISGEGKLGGFSQSSYPDIYLLRNNIKKVVISEGITDIGSYAFQYMQNLTEVYISSTVNDIGTHIFYDSKKIEAIEVSENNNAYCSKDGVLFNKEQSKLVLYPIGKKQITYTVPEGVKIIGAYAFSSAENLESVILPDSIEQISTKAFSDCINLSDIKLGDNVASISANAFDNTSYYNNLNNWENGVLYLEKYLINASKDISGDYTIKEGTTLIAGSAFRQCTYLENVTLPDSLLAIGAGAFYDSGISQINIPDNVRNIEQYAFGSCYRLQNVKLSENITKISSNLFYACKSLQKITLPENITEIEMRAFSHCLALKEIKIPDAVESIGIDAFRNCSALENVGLSNKIKTIPSYMFAGCSALKNIILPDSILSIDASAFEDCKSLCNVQLSANLQSIATESFTRCYSLSKIEFPKSLTEISPRAFSGCSLLSEIEFPGSIEVINRTILSGCSNLKKVVINEGTKTVDISDLGGCQYLYLPKSIAQINADAFILVYSDLKVIYFAGTENDWNNIEFLDESSIPENIKIVLNGVEETPIDVDMMVTTSYGNDALTVNVMAQNNNPDAFSAVCFAAIFDCNGRLKKSCFDNLSISGNDSTLKNITVNGYKYENGDYANVMLVKNLISLQPLTEAKNKSINN